MAAITGNEYNRWKLAKSGDAELFFEKITEYKRNKDFSRHEIKLSGGRIMAIYQANGCWQGSIYR